MRGISPSTQDKWLGKSDTATPVVTSKPIEPRGVGKKLAALEQKIAAIKAENDQLRGLVDCSKPQAFRPQKVAQLVAFQYGYKLSDLRGASRSHGVVVARHHAMWLVRETFKYLSQPAIGRMFGNRDHTTVLHACRAHPKRVLHNLTQPDPDLSWLDEAA
jgi:hypothetical protein